MHKVCVVFDSKVEAYGTPMFFRSTGEALRSFTDEANKAPSESAVASHPEDYTMFEIGTWDDRLGVVQLYEARKSLANAIDLRRDLEPPVKLAK